MQLGRNVRSRRNELNISLRELARRAELSSGFVSQVENDLVSPSLSSLERLADALQVPLIKLLSTDDRSPVVEATARPLVELAYPDVKVQLLTPFLTWQMLPVLRTMEPGEEYIGVRLQRASEEWFFVISGEIEFRLTDVEPYQLGPGDSIHFTSSQFVSMRCLGEDRLEMICIITPPAI